MTPPPAPDSQPVQPELEALFELIQGRYGSRLGPAERDGVRRALQSILEGARALRAIRLSNAEEPCQPFAPFRSER